MLVLEVPAIYLTGQAMLFRYMNRVDNKSGFTIIELLLAMTFVSFLLMGIALTVMQIAVTYNKGLTLKAVNESGRVVVSDMQRTISASRPLDIGTNGTDGINFRPQYRVIADAGSGADGGRLCTGVYSYIWNTGKGLDEKSDGTEVVAANMVNRYEDSDELLRLVKVRDAGALYCNDLDRQVTMADSTELLAGDRKLVIQQFMIKPAVDDTTLQQALYNITLELGTGEQDNLITDAASATTTSDTSCKAPYQGISRNEYCAVNKFEFTARAGNKGEGA
ncbi:MAG: hypothetical protein EOO17_00175 [Chloroflexi bacterium]|nr:MAG: hypothetical protein EOO17_00175 [Chloroflexota bacterium]